MLDSGPCKPEPVGAPSRDVSQWTTFLVLVLVALFWVLVVPNAANARNTVALTYFDNHSGDPSFDALGHGLADMLITDLSRCHPRIVQRSRLSDIMEELGLSDSSFVDPTTAAQLGQGLGATLIVTGSFTTIAPQMRIPASWTWRAEKSRFPPVTGPQEEFLLKKNWRWRWLNRLAPPSAREQARMGNVATESFDAFAAWSTVSRPLIKRISSKPKTP